MQQQINYGNISGVVLIIGYGSIGKGSYPLIKKHFTYQKLVIIDPIEEGPQDQDVTFMKVALTEENYIQVLDSIFQGKKGFCVNVSVGTSSKDIILYCQEKQILYIDTVVEGWEGFYENPNLPIVERTNYALREHLHQANKQHNFKSTAVSCCGANPGMVSWFVKEALMNLAKDLEILPEKDPETRQEWAALMMKAGVKGIHIAERDTQRTNELRPPNSFWNTWSVDGFISEGLYQASELGWGTHQKTLPKGAMEHKRGPKCSIVLGTPGMNTKVKTWCPTFGPQYGFLITHNQSISISDYFTVRDGESVLYRPTCHYAYQPAEFAVTSALECLGMGEPQAPETWKVLNNEITQGMDELGVLLYGHAKNAYWYGSQLTIEDTRKRAPCQNATALQVTSAIVAGMWWALENPKSGLVQNQQMDYKKCLQIQKPYIEPVRGYYTQWTPLNNKCNFLNKQDYDETDPWQFSNVLLNK